MSTYNYIYNYYNLKGIAPNCKQRYNNFIENKSKTKKIKEFNYNYGIFYKGNYWDRIPNYYERGY